MRTLWIVAIVQALSGCSRPPRTECPVPAESTGRVATLIGVARGGKGGPAVVVDGTPVYLPRLDAWPEGWIGEQVVVTGRIATRPGLPADADVGGIVGPYCVVPRASWRLLK